MYRLLLLPFMLAFECALMVITIAIAIFWPDTAIKICDFGMKLPKLGWYLNQSAPSPE